MAQLLRRVLLGTVLLTAILPLATPVLADDRGRGKEKKQDREYDRRAANERQRDWERRRYDNYYRRPDVYYSAPPVVYPPPVQYQQPGAALNFTFPFISR